MRCRNCQHTTFREIINLGNLSLPRFPHKPSKTPHYPLALVKCLSCQLVQLNTTVPRRLLFEQFWYGSNISTTNTADLHEIALEGALEVDAKGIAVDIGANDGTLLKNLPREMRKIGYEPAKNIWTTYERVQDYFSADNYPFPKADLITAIGMFYDLENPFKFCQDVSQCLAEKGCFIIQQNYLPAMVQNAAFDNICHEHLTYFSLTTLADVLRKAKLTIYDYSFNTINGGSFRVKICHEGEKPQAEINEYPINYSDFVVNVRERIDRINLGLATLKGRRVMLYGAGTRGATIYGCIDPFQFEAAVDNNSAKQGRYYLDSNIKIISHWEALKNPPDAFLLLPYFLKDEIVLPDDVEVLIP